MLNLNQIVIEFESLFEIRLPEDYKLFLQTHLSLDKTYDFSYFLNSKKTVLCVDKIFNIVEVIHALTYRHQYLELITNKIIAIGTFLGSEGLCLGIGKGNFGIIYYLESDLNEFIEISNDFGNFKKMISLY